MLYLKLLFLSLCSGLWERDFSEESTDRRTFLGKKYTKVVMMHRAGKKNNNKKLYAVCHCAIPARE